MGLAHSCTRQKGVLCFVPSPGGERNWDAVRVTEVGDLGLRREEAGVHVPAFSAFHSLTGVGDPSVAAAQTLAASRRGGPGGAPRG